MTKKLFGTDGIRGGANVYPMTAETALKIGAAAALFVKEKGFDSIVLGKDTRMSGDMLDAALSAGITGRGVNVLQAGVIPTPGIAFHASSIDHAGAGMVISASHNPYQDNGIKIFKGDGSKLLDSEEDVIEKKVFTINEENLPRETGRVAPLSQALDLYADFLKTTYTPPKDSKTFKIVVDCSNGAAFKVAPKVFFSPYFDPLFMGNTPDGKNINLNCGSEHTEKLSENVVAGRADLGLAFDGDADRLIAVDETGKRITGDTILAVCAKHARDSGRLEPNRIVATVMSNIGFLKAVETLGIECFITDVGDRNVLRKMAQTQAVMGGEDSGHMIFSRYHTTGDGMLTALQLISVMAETGQKLSELAGIMKIYPQVLMNVAVNSSKPDFMAIPPIADAIKYVREQLDSSGRVLVRYSGTQPLLRVMVEGPDEEDTQKYCRFICEKIRQSALKDG
ncbi:MAG: phosphoglucosamine mutase [Thermodesulfobacteriota bacterium]|nr:phosphoglucosamine mutase [Thermodesulfobacteriota bacterium]